MIASPPPRSFITRRRGRVLAVRWGYNPNSSSLGVDVTFLLFGLSIITLLTPLVGVLLRWFRRPEGAALPAAPPILPKPKPKTASTGSTGS